MFHVKHPDGSVTVGHLGGDREPDWRIETRPDGTFWWCVTDWQGETVAHGTTAEFIEAAAQVITWST